MERLRYEKLGRTVTRMKDLKALMQVQITYHEDELKQLRCDGSSRLAKSALLKRRYSQSDLSSLLAHK